MNHHEALTALRNTTSCEVLNSSLSRILQGAASPRTGEEWRGQRLPSWERRSAVSQHRRGHCLQSPSFQGRLLTLTPSTCACIHTHTHTHTHTQLHFPLGLALGQEVLPQSVEAHPLPEGCAWKSRSTTWRQGLSQMAEGTPGRTRDLSIRSLCQAFCH